MRDEFLAVEQFDSLLEAQVLIEDWRIEYNTKRPHSSLGWLARLPTPSAGRLSNTLDSHKRWTREGGPVSLSWDAFAEALGVERKQVLRWRRGTEPSGSAYHALVELTSWIPGGIEILPGRGLPRT